MRFSEEEKAMWLEDWRQSGKSAWVYAKENGLIPQTFTRWTKRRAESKPDPGFVKLPLGDKLPPQHLSEILIEKGNVKIHIPVSLGCGGLRAIMEGLRGVL
jgi:hypothetical protein